MITDFTQNSQAFAFQRREKIGRLLFHSSAKCGDTKKVFGVTPALGLAEAITTEQGGFYKPIAAVSCEDCVWWPTVWHMRNANATP